MRHHKQNRKFGRESGQRRALLKSLAISLIGHKKIVTTEAKAKALRPFIEKLLTHAKRETLNSGRIISSRLGSRSSALLLKEMGAKYQNRPGGYTRISKLHRRKSDGSAMAVIEFV